MNDKYSDDLFARSEYDKKYSDPWQITDAQKQNDGTYIFESRQIERHDFDNIRSSLLNGQQEAIIYCGLPD